MYFVIIAFLSNHIKLNGFSGKADEETRSSTSTANKPIIDLGIFLHFKLQIIIHLLKIKDFPTIMQEVKILKQKLKKSTFSEKQNILKRAQ